ncbi:MAG TPA: hypothetical protein DET40_18585 [Lentisphaeria bacterium]|nr:MAG: hypothetical protein A2X45_10925 [Lentisphaerae bacterium GWF2_50_93]HCE45552.1 hypothetical protein [Lentisphaeria bacterium]
MKTIPIIKRVGVNSGTGIAGTFLDEEFVFHYIAGGRWNFRMEDRMYRIAPGNIILLPPFMLHVVRPVDRRNLVQYVIHFELLEGLSDLQKLPMVVSIPLNEQKRIAGLFSQVKREWRSPEPGSDLISAGILTQFLGIYRRYSDDVPPSNPVNSSGWQNIERGIKFIHANYQRPGLTIGEVSRNAGQSMPYFCKLFKDYIGMPPLLYLNNYRISFAKELMINTASNLSEIAEKTGFSSIYTFSKVFKKISGECPSGWLEKAMR